MTANDASIDARDWSLLGLLSVLWGGSFFFNGVVLKELPPFTVVFLRVALAAIDAAAAAVALPHPFPGRPVWAGGRSSPSGFSTTCCRSR